MVSTRLLIYCPPVGLLILWRIHWAHQLQLSPSHLCSMNFFSSVARSPCSTIWMGCQSRWFLCLFWRETRQMILGHEISPYPEVVRGREWKLTSQPSRGQLALDSRRELTTHTQQRAVGAGQQAGVDETTQQRAVGGWTAERRAAESWRGTTDRGSQHRTPETVGDKIGSSEEDRLKMSAFEVLVEFSLVTHASNSPHMHIVLQYLFSALG